MLRYTVNLKKKMSIGLWVFVCVCVCGWECVRKGCEAEVSGLSLLKSTSMLKRDWVMTQGFLKSVSIQHVACENSWISYNKHLFVSILCVVCPKQSVLSLIPLSHLMVQLSVQPFIKPPLTVCACFCPINKIQRNAFSSKDRLLTLRVGHIQV